MVSDPYDTGPYLQWEIREVWWHFEDRDEDKLRHGVLISDNEANKTGLFLRFLKFSGRNRASQYKIHIPEKHPERPLMGIPPEQCWIYVDKTQRIPKGSKVRKAKGKIGTIIGTQIVAMLKQIELDDQAAGAQPIPSPQPPK